MDVILPKKNILGNIRVFEVFEIAQNQWSLEPVPNPYRVSGQFPKGSS